MKIINFPFCNFFSFQRYLEIRSISYSILSESNPPETIEEFIVIPGVGTFGQAMDFLSKKNLIPIIKSHVQNGGNLLGICLGMQLFFDSSNESKDVDGLGIIKGKCSEIKECEHFKVPHIGWNEIECTTKYSIFNNLLNKDFNSKVDFYFVHSYIVNPSDNNLITSTFKHPESKLCASVQYENAIGLQFHPEKSGQGGYHLLDNIFKFK